MKSCRSVFACAVLVALVCLAALPSTGNAQTSISWDAEKSGGWLKNGFGLDFLTRSIASSGGHLLLANTELRCRDCVIAPVPGGAEDFDAVSTVAEDGYTDTIAVSTGNLFIVRLTDGRHAKVLLEADHYDPANANPNAAGVMVTFVLSTVNPSSR